MTVYFIKTIVCSAILLGIYHLLLSKEKMYRFNRIYLLLSIIIPFLLPVFVIHLPEHRSSTAFQLIEPMNLSFISDMAPQPLQSTSIYDGFDRYSVFLFSYLSVSGMLFYRFCKNIVSISRSIRFNKQIVYKGAKIVLLHQNQTPHSFLHYIFLHKESYEKGLYKTQITTHELTHVKEKHTLDILFYELVLLAAWWNPFLPLYKKAIRLNHEFLADDTVIHKHKDVFGYQRLLLQKAAQTNQLSLLSQFNFSITKKRFLMMTKHTTRTVAALKQLAVLLLLTVFALIFSNKIVAQTEKDSTAVDEQKITSGSGASQELLHEYDSTIRNMHSIRTLQNGKQVDVVDMRKGDINRLAFIYHLMNNSQREERVKKTGLTIDSITPPKPNMPTEEQLHRWTDAKIYGVWIDGKRITNSSLNRYKPIDFVLYSPSRLEKNAVKNDHFLYQINLMTPNYYHEIWESGTHYIVDM